MKRETKNISTQQYLPISSIEQDMVILRNGGVRKILRAYPINFELRSEQEQNAIIFSYQAFLNSLNFPIEICVRSRRLDLERYLVKMESQTKNISNNLLQIHAQDYISFVRRLIQIANIMSKQFYVVVGYQTAASSMTSLIGFLQTKKQIILSPEQFQAAKNEVENRASIVAAGLNSVGIRTTFLTTQELIELFYNNYNPEESMTERLAPVDELEAQIVTSAEEEMQRRQKAENQANNYSQNQWRFLCPKLVWPAKAVKL